MSVPEVSLRSTLSTVLSTTSVRERPLSIRLPAPQPVFQTLLRPASPFPPLYRLPLQPVPSHLLQWLVTQTQAPLQSEATTPLLFRPRQTSTQEPTFTEQDLISQQELTPQEQTTSTTVILTTLEESQQTLSSLGVQTM